MADESPIVLVLAHYDLRNDAQNDLDAVQRFIVDNSVAFYDGAFITTDAWDQVQVTEWETPLLSHPASVVRRALAGLAGRRTVQNPPRLHALRGPVEGLEKGDLERVGDTLPRDATALVVAVQTGHRDSFVACFAHASRIASKDVAVGGDGAYPALGAALDDLMSTPEPKPAG